MRTRLGLVALALALMTVLAGCGSKSADSTDGRASYCPAASAYEWWRGYAQGKFGGPPADTAGIQQAIQDQQIALSQLKPLLPKPQAKNAAAVGKTWTYVANYYRQRMWQLTNAEYHHMMTHAPKTKTQSRALNAYLQSHCAAGKNNWPTKPADAKTLQ